MKIKSRHATNSFMFLMISAILLTVSFLGFAGAWFTDSKSAKITGSVPVVAVNVYHEGLTKSDNVYIFAQHDSGDSYSTPSISFKSVSSIGVYVRARFAINWSSLDASLGSVFDYVVFDLTDYWYNLSGDNSDDSSDDNDLIQSGWLYFKDTSEVVSDFDTRTILDDITLEDDMPDSVTIQLYVEVVQANALGLQKLGTYPANWLTV